MPVDTLLKFSVVCYYIYYAVYVYSGGVVKMCGVDKEEGSVGRGNNVEKQA